MSENSDTDEGYRDLLEERSYDRLLRHRRGLFGL